MPPQPLLHPADLRLGFGSSSAISTPIDAFARAHRASHKVLNAFLASSWAKILSLSRSARLFAVTPLAPAASPAVLCSSSLLLCCFNRKQPPSHIDRALKRLERASFAWYEGYVPQSHQEGAQRPECRPACDVLSWPGRERPAGLDRCYRRSRRLAL